jgi:hypothetical protein
MTANGKNINPNARCGPAWAYVLGGALGLPFAVTFVLGVLHLHSMDFGVPSPGALALFGVLLGGKAYLIFSKPLPPQPERDLSPS